MQAFDFKVIYVEGEQNKLPDAFSRFSLPIHAIDKTSAQQTAKWWIEQQDKDAGTS